MKDVKSFFASKTIWGAFVAILGALLPMFGLSFSAEDGQILLSLIDETISIGGALWAMYGRLVAKEKVALLPS